MKKNNLHKLSLIFCLVIAVLNSRAQQIRFTSLTIDDGLSQSMVKQICQDRLGYVWIATQDGLNKYNGYNFTVYRNNIYDSTSISDNNIAAIVETNDNLLYIGTQNGGLNVYNPYRNIFSKIHINNDTINYQNVKSIVKDTKNNLWILADNSIFQYKTKQDIWVNITKHLPQKVRFTTLYFKDDVLWIGSDRGIYAYNTVSKQVNKYAETSKAGEQKFTYVVKDILLADDATLWFATTGMGLCKLNLKNNQYQYLLFEDELGNIVNDISVDSEGRYWIASAKGIGVFNGKKWQKFVANGDKNGLLSNRVNYIYTAADGNVWVGTDGGINVYKKYLLKFEHIYKPSNAARSNKYPSGNTIMCFEQLNDSVIVVGNLDYGLDFWYANSNTFENFPTYKNKLHFRILSLLNDTANKKLWIGSWGGGFNYFDTQNKRFSSAYDINRNCNGTRLANNTILDLENGPDNTLWIGTYNGLSVFDIDKQTFKNYFTFDGLPSNTINHIVYDKKHHRIWIGTSAGLAFYNFQDGKFYSLPVNNHKLLQNKSVNTILLDGEIIWLGTSQGLIKYNISDNIAKGYFLPNGLPNEYIYGILKDTKNNLWISTNNGLSRFNIQKETFKNYSEEDGLQSNEFNQGAYFKDTKGVFYFGGINGFNTFIPEKIIDNPITPKVFITRILLPKGELKTDSTVFFKKSISLQYKDAKSITIEFEGLEYTLPQENLYQWKLEGFDDDWSEPTKRRFAIYSNLNGGENIFKVRAANHDGVWNSTPTELKIIIIPPFYQTATFYIGIFILAIIIVLLIIRIRTRRIIAEKKKLEEKVQERTKELNEKNKDILSSIEYAKRIQEAILPSTEKIKSAFKQSFIIYLPKDIVSGDFYWFAETKDNYFLAAVDCTGHGVPGAFMSMIGNSLLNQIVQIQKIEQTGDILNKLNERVVQALNQHGSKFETKDGMDLSIIRKSKINNTIEYSGAFRPLYIIRNNGMFEKIDADKKPIGGSIEEGFSFQSHFIQVNENDTIYMFSDGYPDQFGGEKNKKFMVKNFQKLLLSVYHLPVEEQQKIILNTFNDWKGTNEQIDDVLVIGIKF
jgi:ligand-binding sensor domain-containing protein/serine phosphatase RsbU (regulator of sigma subunit)